MDIKKYIAACKKVIKPDLVIKNGNIVNVFSNEIIKADIAICDETIVGIGDYDCKNIIDATDKFVSPGFIDAHIHIESSMISPCQFADIVSKDGTTTMIADPHEIVNVFGGLGIDYMLNETKNSNCDVFFTLPSCVPATKFENNGYTFSSTDMKRFLDNPKIIGLGEVMDYVSVLESEENIIDKLNFFKNRPIDGHAPGITKQNLQSYKMSGITTDHECINFEEALEKLRLGFYILIRDGSAAHNLKDILGGFIKNNINLERCCFCTDDKHIDDIKKYGHITYHIRKSVSMGIPPIQAIKMATLNTAICYGLSDIGAISVGYKANIVILNDLKEFRIENVIYGGKEIDLKNKLKCIAQNDILPKNSINITTVDKNSIKIEIDKTPTSVIEIIDNQIITKHSKYNIKDKNFQFTPYDDFNKIVVIERHHQKNSIGKAIIKGFGIKNGAIGTTIAHDSHNIIIIGDNDIDILNTLNYIKEIGGGYVISSNEKILESLPLEIGGLMTSIDEFELSKKLNKLHIIASSLGVNKNIDPFITMSFLALPVIPEIRVTDKGLFDVNKFEFIS